MSHKNALHSCSKKSSLNGFRTFRFATIVCALLLVGIPYFPVHCIRNPLLKQNTHLGWWHDVIYAPRNKDGKFSDADNLVDPLWWSDNFFANIQNTMVSSANSTLTAKSSNNSLVDAVTSLLEERREAASPKDTLNGVPIPQLSDSLLYGKSAIEDADPDKCYIIAFAGGGINKGAYQAGALRGIVERHAKERRDLRWDMVAAVGPAAPIALASLGFEPGKGDFSWGRMVWGEFWNMTQHDVTDCEFPLNSTHNIWQWSKRLSQSFLTRQNMQNTINRGIRLARMIVSNIFPATGAGTDALTTVFKSVAKFGRHSGKVLNSKKLEWVQGKAINATIGAVFPEVRPQWQATCKNDAFRSFVATRMTGKKTNTQRLVAISASRENDGKFVTWYEDTTNKTELLDAAIASASVAGVFPPIRIGNDWLTDGNLVAPENLIQSVERCMTMKNVNETMVVIDYVSVIPSEVPHLDNSGSSTSVADIMTRSFDMMQKVNKPSNILMELKAVHPNALVRYFISPGVSESTLVFPVNNVNLVNPQRSQKLLQSGFTHGYNAKTLEEAVRESQGTKDFDWMAAIYADTITK